MASFVTRTVGVFGLAIGIAWTIWPLRMVELQYRLFYFWRESPDVEEYTNPTLARVSGIVLAALGAALVIGLLP